MSLSLSLSSFLKYCYARYIRDGTTCNVQYMHDTQDDTIFAKISLILSNETKTRDRALSLSLFAYRVWQQRRQ